MVVWNNDLSVNGEIGFAFFGALCVRVCVGKGQHVALH